MQLIRELAPALSAIGGAAIGVAGGVITTLIMQRSEERKHLRSLAFTAGIENYKANIEMAKDQPGSVTFSPLDIYILNMRYLSEVVEKKDISADELVAALKRNFQLIKSANDFIHKKSVEEEAAMKRKAEPAR